MRFQRKSIEAEALFIQVLQLGRKALGPDHELTLDALNALGDFYAWEKQPEKAIPLYKQAITAKRWALGSHHPSLLWSLLCLDGALLNLGRNEEARATCEEAMELSYRILGPAASKTGIALDHLSTLHGQRGSKDDLHAFHRKYVVWLEGRERLTNDANIYPLQPRIHAEGLNGLVHYQLLNAPKILDPALCVETAHKAVDLVPDEWWYHVTLAWTYTAAQCSGDAENGLLGQARRHRPADKVRPLETFILAMIRNGQGDAKQARSLYEDGVAMQERSGDLEWTYNRLRPQLKALFDAEP